MAGVVDGDEETSRTTVDVAEFLTGQTHCRRVDDGHHLLDVLRQDAVEQTLVTILIETKNRIERIAVLIKLEWNLLGVP